MRSDAYDLNCDEDGARCCSTEGMRALSIGVNDVGGVDGFVLQNDRDLGSPPQEPPWADDS
jgi:hypothetical protein